MLFKCVMFRSIVLLEKNDGVQKCNKLNKIIFNVINFTPIIILLKLDKLLRNTYQI